MRQLVKACLLEISKLKIDLKKCQKEASNVVDESAILGIKENAESKLQEKEKEINNLQELLEKKDQKLEELEIIKYHFNALTAKTQKGSDLLPVAGISITSQRGGHIRKPVHPYN